MPLINCKINLELNWRNDCVMSSIAEATTFQIKSTKLYVRIVTLSTKNNVDLTKQLNGVFWNVCWKVCWNEYKSKIETKEANNANVTRFPFDASFQAVNRLFALAFNDTTQNVAGNPISNTANRIQRDSPSQE